MNEREDEIEARLKKHPEEDGIVVGDETRLRQVITNLARCVCFLLALSESMYARFLTLTSI